MTTTSRVRLWLLASVLVVSGLMLWLTRLSASPLDSPDLPSVLVAPGTAPAEVAEPAIEPRRELAREVGLVFLVLDGAGRPHRDARVLVFGGHDDSVGEGRTDEAGIAHFAGREGEGGAVVVTATGRTDVLHRIRLQGMHELRIDESAYVAGTVLVDGRPAPDGLELGLTTDSPALPANAPEGLYETIDGAMTQRVTRTRAGGAFSFDGLSPSWRGRLLPPTTHWRTDVESDMFGAAHRSMLLEAPRRDVRLQLTQLPTARGRVVWDDTGEGIGGAHVTAHARTKDGAAASGSGTTREDGTFAIGLTPTTGGRQRAWSEAALRPELVDLRVSCHEAAGSDGPSQVEVDATKAKEPIELRVRRANAQHFVAVDEDGNPVAGAVVDRSACTPTESTGHGSWRGGEAKFVGAPGRSVVPARPLGGDGSAASPFRFVLPRDCSLLVAVRDLPDAGRTAAQVVVESTTPLLAEGTKWPTPLHHRLGSGDWSGGSRRRTKADGATEEVLELRCRAPRHGPARLSSLEPDTACEVRLEDSLGRTLASTRIRTPARGSVQELELTAGATARLVSGRVLDTNGNPLARAEVRVAAERDTVTAFTTRDGRFAVLASGPVRLRVRAMLAGYVMQEREVEPEAETEELEFHLANGRSATVRTLDARGNAVEMYAWPLGYEPLQGQRLSPGVWQWSDLPGEVEFATELQGKRWTVRCTTEQTDAVLRVPELATLVVTPRTVPDGRGVDRNECVVELRSVDEPELEIVRVGLGGAGDREQLLLPGRYVATVVKPMRAGSGVTARSVDVGITADVVAVAGARVELRFP